jgi:hypothetical protein
VTSSRVLVVLSAIVLLLTGCAPTADQPVASPTASATATPTPTPTPSEPQPSAVLVSLDDLTVVDAEGAPLSSVPLSEPDLLIDFLTQLEGAAPTVVDNRKFGMSYTWAGASVVVNFELAFFRATAPTIGGFPVVTSQGIKIGSTQAEVLALGPVDPGYDGDGDGQSDYLGLEARVRPGSESLVTPGQEGIDYIEVTFTGDLVSSISLGNDWYDV